MQWLADHLWAVWLAIMIVLGAAEMASLDLVLAMLAVGAGAGLITSLLGAGLPVQIVVAAVASTAMLGAVRPSVMKRLHTGPELRLGHGKLVGQRAVVTTRITGLQVGQIRLDGETWSASPYDEHLTIAPGETVEVFEIRGATALVHPVPTLE